MLKICYILHLRKLMQSERDIIDIHGEEVIKMSLGGRKAVERVNQRSMKKSRDGPWKIKMKLPRGKCEYKYFVDGAWAQDISGAETISNPFGTSNCVIDIR